MNTNRTPEDILEEVLASMDESGVATGPASEPAVAELDELTFDDGENGAGEGGDLSAGLPGDEDGEGTEEITNEGEGTFEGEGEGEGTEEITDEGEDDGYDPDVDDDDEDAPIEAFASIEATLEAIASAQGLDNIPQGVVASGEALVDYLLATGAIIELELPKISAAAVQAREAAFAHSELLALADDLDAIGDDLTDEPEVELEDGAAAGSEPEAPVADPAPAAEPTEPAAPVEEPAAPVAPAEEPTAEGEACMASANTQRFHPVADASMIATAAAADVQLVFAHTGENPRYNVIIAGVPAAVITWNGVRAAGTSDAAFASFCGADYSRNILSTMQQQGVGTVLAALNAEFYANAYTQSDLATQIQASVQQEAAADYQARVIAMRGDLVDMGNLAMAGLARGFFKTPNPMHAHAVAVLAAEGVHNPERVALVLSEALPETFDVVMAKAVEFMDRSPEFVQQTREAIGEMNPRLRVGASEAPVAPVTAASMSLGQRLSQSALASSAPVAPAAPTIATANARPSSVNDWHARLQGRIHLGARQ